MKTTRAEAITVLAALHDLSEKTLPIDLGVLAGRLGWGVGRAVRVIAHLEKLGLADRGRCRLTLAGLGVAVALRDERAASQPSAAIVRAAVRAA
jgi:DNA-binding MarR family transcriptional regulator